MMGLGIGHWYTAPSPISRTTACTVGPVLAKAIGKQSLPLLTHLAGTPVEITLGMEWVPKRVGRGTHLEKLTLYYMEFLTHLAPEHALNLIKDWIHCVPPYLPGYWKDTWNSYGLSIRVVTWMDIVSRSPEAADPATRAIIDQSIAAQLRFLVCNLETDIGGNHLMKNIRALLRGGRFFQGHEADQWLQLGLRELTEQIREQVLPDGLHFELSPAYHLQVLEDLMDMRRAVAAAAAEQGPCSAAAQDALRTLDDALRRMALAARRLMHPDGLPSLFADGGLHMASTPRALLETLAEWHVIKPAEMDRVLGVWKLPDGGYVGHATEQSLLVVDCGPVGARHLPAHGHGDALAIEWSVGGKRFIVDAGVFEYHQGARRAFSRSTAAHNTVTVGDADQSEFWSSFRVARRANVRVDSWEPQADGFRLAATHDGYRRMRGCPRHSRLIDASASKLVVRDTVQGGAGQAIRARLLLAATARVGNIEQLPTGQWRANIQVPGDERDGRQISAELVSSVAMHTVSLVASTDFGELVPCTQIVMEGGAAPGQIEWAITVG